MATFNSAIFLEQKETRVNPSRLATPNVASGDVQFAVIPYTIAGTEVTGDIINLCLLPHGAIPMPMLSKVVTGAAPAPEGSLVIDVGDADNPDGFTDGLDISVGGAFMFTAGGTAPAWVAPTPIVADSNSGNALIYATLADVDTSVTDAVLYFVLAWKLAR